jgi:hypothetical protein
MHRVARVAGEHPALADLVGVKLFEMAGWNFVPYSGGQPAVTHCDGWLVAHYMTVGGREIRGRFPAKAALDDKRANCLFAHHHTRQMAAHTNGDGTYTRAICAGCFVSDDFKATASYAGDHKRHWWQGIVVAGPDWEDWWSLERLRQAFA